MAKSIRARLGRPVVMIGLMGAGKTRIGGMLANALDVPFVDADHEIETMTGMTIARIFQEQGESAFRVLERENIARLLTGDVKIIATGGGAIMNEETAALVWDKSVSVWLRAGVDTLTSRTAKSDTRPLLQTGNPRDILAGLIERRYPSYSNATLTVDTDEADVQTVLGRVMNSLDAYLPSKDIPAHV